MKKLKLILLLFISFAFVNSASADGEVIEIPPTSGLKGGALTDHGLFKNYRKLAEVVIVIDKSKRVESKSGQSLTVFKNGQFVKRYTISSGAETIKQPNPDIDYTYLATTPTGYFRPASSRAYEVYHSNTWGGVSMPYALFFVGGIAIHGTKDINNLANNVSGGCVRMFTDQAKEVRDYVLSSGSSNPTYLVDATTTSKYDESVLLIRSRVAGNMVSVPRIDRYTGEFNYNKTIKSWDTVIIVGKGSGCNKLPSELCFK